MSSVKIFIRLNILVVAVLLLALGMLNFQTESSLFFIFSSFIVIGLGGFSLTIARRLYRNRIKQREQLLSQIFNNVSDGLLLVYKRNGRIIEVNDVVIDILGKNREELKKIRIKDISILEMQLFEDIEKNDNKTIELADERIITYHKKSVNFEGNTLWIIQVKTYKNRKELNAMLEFEKLIEYQEQSYTSLFKNSASIICIINREGIIIDVNKAVSELLKTPIKDIIGKPYDHFDYELPTYDRTILNKKAWLGEEQMFEKTIKDVNGRRIDIEVILMRGNYFGKEVLISNSRNITQRKKVEKEIMSVSKNYTTLFLESPICMLITDLKGNVLEINPAFEKLVGFKRKELIGMNEAKLCPSEDMSALLKLKESLLSGEKTTLEFEKRYLSKEGKEIIGLVKVIVQKNEENVPVSYLAQIVDITKGKKFEKQLKLSEKSYKDIFNNSRELLYIIDKENNFIDVNKSVIEKYGYSKKEFLKLRPTLLSADENNDEDKLSEKIENAWNKGTEKIFWWSKTKTGKVIPKELFLGRGEYFGKEVLIASGRDVSERMEYEKELKKERKKYEELIDSAIFGIAILRENKLVFANKKARQILKADKKVELIGKSTEDFIRKEDFAAFEQRLKLLKKEKDIPLREFTLNALDGEEISVEMKPSEIEFENEDCILLSFIDLKDRKEAEYAQQKVKEAKILNKSLKLQLEQNRLIQKRLKNSQSYSEGIIESSMDMIFTTDIDGRINKLNSSAIKTLEYENVDYSMMPFHVLFEDKIIAREILKKLSIDKSFSGEVKMKKKGGDVFNAYLSISYLYSMDGTFLGTMGVSRDITEIKAKEIEIKEQASKLKAIIESSSHSFFTVDRKLKMVSFNKQFHDDILKRYDYKVEKGTYFFDLFKVQQDQDLDEIKRFWSEMFDLVFKGENINFETSRIDIKGRPFFRDVYLNPVRKEDGEITEISAIGHDITEKKIAEIELKKSLEEKEVLLKEVHHRVKNNMQVISSILNLQSAYINDEKILNILRESQNRIRAMASIHERLYQTKNFSDIRFASYVKNLAENLINTYELTDKTVELSCKLDEVYLTLTTSIPCGLIINELISNSLKYAFEGRKKGRISIVLRKNDGKVTLIIEDNGVGIPESINFRKTESLGLQLVNTLVEQIEGSIKLDREKGTAFTIMFKPN
jgi:PAS domain S-box-containing protein